MPPCNNLAITTLSMLKKNKRMPQLALLHIKEKYLALEEDLLFKNQIRDLNQLVLLSD